MIFMTLALLSDILGRSWFIYVFKLHIWTFFSDSSTCLLQLQFLFLADFNDSAIKSIEIQVSDHFDTSLLERYQLSEVMYVDE